MLDSSLKKTLEADHPFLQTVIDALPVPVFYKDTEGLYLGCNIAFESFINISRTELIGKSVFDLYPEDDAELYHRKDQELFEKNGDQIYEAEIHAIDGDPHIVQFHKSTFHNRDGSVAGLIGTIFDITDRKKLEQRLARLASYDELTGIYNRREATKRLKQAVRAARRNGSCVSVILLDIDHFKQINDTHGHHTGDQALVEVARHLPHCCRETDLVARFGGEEFLVILPDTDQKEALEVAERIRLCMELTPIEMENGDMLALTASFGISSAENHYCNENTLVHQADAALYEAKRDGRNRIVPYRPAGSPN